MMVKKKHLKLIHSTDGSDGYVEPEALKDFLQPCQLHEITFQSEAHMQSYRRMLYTVNKQGDVRYRTMRSEGSMWAIAIWRMK